MTSVSPTSTVSDEITPTLPAARSHQTSRITHENTLPTCETIGSRPAALSTKRPAFMIASSSASAQIAAGAMDPFERNNNRPRLAINTAPLPHAGVSGRDPRRAIMGTASETTPKIA